MDTTTTRKEGYELIRQAVSEFMDGREVSDNTLTAIALAVGDDLQLRDYLLGLPLEQSLEVAGGFIEMILSREVLTNEQAVPFLVVLSAFYYEAGDNDRAHLALMEAEKINADYALLTLLKRVFSSGSMTPASFATMRDELHPKVLKEILG